jgi:polyribonucleotide nucleotidyltransferase
LHISEVAEHRIKDVRDELKEGDQVLVKVLAVEGNRIKLSRKAVLKEQRAKMGGGAPAPPPEGEAAPEPAPASQAAPTAIIEGGAEFGEDDEPNFNRVDAPVSAEGGGAGRPEGGRDGRGGGGDRDRNRRRRHRGGRGPGGGHGGGHGGGGGGRGRR